MVPGRSRNSTELQPRWSIHNDDDDDHDRFYATRYDKEEETIEGDDDKHENEHGHEDIYIDMYTNKKKGNTGYETH